MHILLAVDGICCVFMSVCLNPFHKLSGVGHLEMASSSTKVCNIVVCLCDVRCYSSFDVWLEGNTQNKSPAR